jgi:AcrR family transcriptional regulator
VTGDLETRQRLLEAAAQLFAQRGLHDVPVREICAAARANVAAINYHFGGKIGLYTAVARKAIEAIRGTNDIVRQAGEGASPEEKLRIYARVFLERIAANGRDAWIHQLISREMAEPTPAFELIIRQAIRPRIEYLSSLVSELLQCHPDDARVTRCVASMQSQFLFWLNPGVGRIFPRLNLTSPTIDELADHIAEFSLAGIRALAHPRATGTTVRKARRRVKAS